MILLKSIHGSEEGGGGGSGMSMSGFEQLMKGMKEEMWTRFVRQVNFDEYKQLMDDKLIRIQKVNQETLNRLTNLE